MAEGVMVVGGCEVSELPNTDGDKEPDRVVASFYVDRKTLEDFLALCERRGVIKGRVIENAMRDYLATKGD